MLQCSVCKLEKDESEFAKASKKQRGYATACKVCTKEKYRGTEESKASARDAKLRHKYGITVKKFDKLMTAQGGRCAICNRTLEWGDDRHMKPHVDHDHETGAVRGILCGYCNLMIGWSQDTPERLIAGAKYLNSHPRGV